MHSLTPHFYCRPGVSKVNKSKIGLIAVNDIPCNTKVLNRPCHHGHWCYTTQLEEQLFDKRVILELQDLFRNKKLFMQDQNRLYTFVPDIPLYEFHGEMFLNSSRSGNVILKKNGYYTQRDITSGEELLLV
jgi:hypothetical protein